MNISIIIPTLNESLRIGDLLRFLTNNYKGVELIVVDGGSIDDTVPIAEKYARVFKTNKGRGRQLNFGARHANGDILWFLHADTIPHPDALQAIRSAFSNDKIVGGAFRYAYTNPSMMLKLFCHLSNYKNQLQNNIYGDMGIFVNREIFQKMNGYQETMLMEDYAFSKAIKKYGAIKILPQTIVTSPRDWEKEGFLKKIFKDAAIKCAFNFKINNESLYRWYYGEQQ